MLLFSWDYSGELGAMKDDTKPEMKGHCLSSTPDFPHLGFRSILTL